MQYNQNLNQNNQTMNLFGGSNNMMPQLGQLGNNSVGLGTPGANTFGGDMFNMYLANDTPRKNSVAGSPSGGNSVKGNIFR